MGKAEIHNSRKARQRKFYDRLSSDRKTYPPQRTRQRDNQEEERDYGDGDQEILMQISHQDIQCEQQSKVPDIPEEQQNYEYYEREEQDGLIEKLIECIPL